MEPTLMVGDKVIINKLAYRFEEVKKGDIIAFHSITEGEKEITKRVIAVEGDKILLTSEGEIFVNDEKVIEGYIQPGQEITYLNQEFIIGQDELFVMGDNRNNSFDSRYFGTIPEENVFGKFVIVYWPPSRW
jgi:signal peptidase I